MKKMLLCIALLAGVCQVSAFNKIDLSQDVRDQLTSGVFVSAASLYLGNMLVNFAGRKYRRSQKTTTALKEAEIKRMEATAKKIVPLLVALYFAKDRFMHRFNRGLYSHNFSENALSTLASDLSYLGGFALLAVPALTKLQERGRELDKQIALLKHNRQAAAA